MPSKIALLDEETINLIAAGEVVEGPGSIVKELVENSLDAGATRLFISIAGGGLDRIIVEDNGCGMSEEDVLVSIMRHATSKIKKADELYCLSTFGFRGEALAAIAAASKLTIATKEKSEDGALIGDGVILTVQGGKNPLITPTQCRQGTRIEVGDLFFNTPARRKFLKGPNRCAFEVTKTVTALALAHPDVAFEYVHDEETIINVEAMPLPQRMQHLLGVDYAQGMQYVEVQNNVVKAHGFFSIPEKARHNRSGQYIFVMDRPIYSPLISNAVKEAYGTTIDKERHPQFVLFLAFSKGECDVNVHPQKKEVRFSQEETIKEVLFQAVQQVLFQHTPVTAEPAYAECHALTRPSYEPRVYSPRESLAFQAPCYHVANERKDQEATWDYLPPAIKEEEVPLQLFSCSVLGIYQKYAFAQISWGSKQVPEELQREGVILVDIAALFSRLAMEQLQTQTTQTSSQMLLTPIFMEFSPLEMSRLKEKLPVLQEIGFDIRLFSTTSVLVEAVPQAVAKEDVQESIRQSVLDEDVDRLKLMRRLAQRAGMPIRKQVRIEEVQLAIKKLLELSEWRFGSQGEPIFAPLFLEEIEKKFH